MEENNKNDLGSKKNKESFEKKESLSKEELFDVLKFATTMDSFITNAGVYTPYLVNDKLKQITSNPIFADADKIQDVLKDPQNNENLIISYNECMEYIDSIYKRSVEYLGNLMSFDFTYSCSNIFDKSEYKTDLFKKDYYKFKDFMTKFDYRKIFKQILRVMVKKETYFGLFRTDGSKYVFQELPREYTKITGKWENGIMFDFNMQWFIAQYGINLQMYPDIMREKFIEIMRANGVDEYNPANKLNKRKGTFVYWVQTSPENGFWAFKFNPDDYSNIPYFTNVLIDAANRPLIKQLQTNQYIIAAQKVMVGLIPMLKDVKSGSIKDQVAIAPETMGKFLGLLKAGLSDLIKVGAAPFEDVKVLDFKPNDESMLDEYNRTYSGASGVTSRLVYASDKMSASEIEYSADIDRMIVEYLYPHFADFINYQLEFNDDIKTEHYKFQVKFEGSNLSAQRKIERENTFKWAGVGIVLPQKIASTFGLNPFEFESQLEMAKELGFVDKLLPLININTQSQGNVGRPESNNINDSTQVVKDNS